MMKNTFINKIRIRKFKKVENILKRIKRQIVPRKINVLIGPNGSGKSKLLGDLYMTIEYAQLADEEFSNGFDQIVEVGAANISGVQLFRVALARTIYHSQEILLIDDNFTSIDLVMRKRLLKSLQELNKTIVFVDQQKRDYYKNYNCILLEEVQ